LLLIHRFLIDENRDAENINPDYEAWEVQDQMLLVWLQSMMSKFFVLIHSYRVWDKIHDHYHMQTKARARQMLLVWLQLMLSKFVLSRVIVLIHSYQVWDKIHDHYHMQTKACAR